MHSLKLVLHALVMIVTASQVCHSASLHLTWNANTEADLAGYKVYYGQASGVYGEDPIDVGKVTEYELSGLNEGITYYIAITAYDTSDNESEKSDEASGVAHLPPAGIELESGIQDGGSVEPLEEDLYYISIPAGQGYLLVELTGNPDADLYVRYGLPPTTAQFDCRPYAPDSSNEICSFTNPESGTWYLMVQGYAETVDYGITATYNTGPPPVTTTTTAPPPLPTTTTTAPPSSTTVPVTTTAPPSSTTVPVTTTAPPSSTTVPVTTTAPSSSTTVPVTTTAPPSSTTVPGTTTAPSSSTTVPVTTTAPPTTTVPSTTSISPETTTIPSIDTTPPTGALSINNGVATTYSLTVILGIAARDNGQELDKLGFMSFSNDLVEWSDPEPYATAKLWTLSPGEGTKTVYAQLRDAAGNWMPEPIQDTIIYEESDNACEEPQKLQPVATSASSQLLPLFAKENAVDGNPSTAWSTLFSFFKKDEFITLDLGEIKRINWFTMRAASTLFGTDYFPVNFKIEISSDTTTWEKISTEQDYAPPLQSTHSDSWDFKSLECRYIRVYITKAKSILFFFKLAQIAEIEVYGCTPFRSTPLLASGDPSPAEEEVFSTEGNSQHIKGIINRKQMLPTVPGKPTITSFKEAR